MNFGHTHKFAFAALLWVNLFATGCALDLPAEEAEAGVVLCEQTSDCLPDETCEANFCVVSSDQLEVVAIQLTPSSDSGLVREQFPMVDFEQGESLPDLQLTQAVQLTGLINSSKGAPVTATVVANRLDPSIPGLLPLRFETTTLRDPNTDYTFLLQLPRGIYEIAIHPDGSDLPSQYLMSLPIMGDTQQTVTFEALEDHYHAQGRIVFTDGQTGAIIPVPRVKLQAFDDNQRTVSRVATTDLEGNFGLQIRPNITGFYLSINPADYSEAFPRVQTGTWLLSGAQGDLGDINLGELHLTGGSRVISGQLTSGDEPIANANLIFRGEVGAGKVTQIVVTDDQGRYEHRLQPGLYDPLIVPPIDSPHAVTLNTGLVLPTPREGEVPTPFTAPMIRDKIIASGVLLSPRSDAVVAGARITFVPQAYGAFDDTEINEANPFRSFVDGRPSSTIITQSDGSFGVMLDPGVYTIESTPPEASGYGLSVVYREPIYVDTTDIELTAGRSNVAYGRVLAPNGKPLPDVQLEIFRINNEGTRLIGVGQTDAKGAYRILLPEISAIRRPMAQ